MAFNFFKKLVGGLNKTQQVLVRGIDDVMNRHEKIDEEFYDDLEEIMIKGDIGVRTTEEILDELREKVREQRVKKPIECGDLLIESIRSRMQTTDEDYAFEKGKSVASGLPFSRETAGKSSLRQQILTAPRPMNSWPCGPTEPVCRSSAGRTVPIPDRSSMTLLRPQKPAAATS